MGRVGRSAVTRWGAALAVTAMLAGAGRAAEEPSASHIAAARELVGVAGAAAGVERVIPALLDDLRKQAVTRPELVKDLDEVIKSLEPELEAQRQQALVIAARVYARMLSESDIRDTVTFFRSPVGARYILAQPDITEEVVNNLTAWSQLVAEYIQARVRSEMLKRGHQLQ